MRTSLRLFETRVGRRIVGLFMAGAVIPVLALAWVVRAHVGEQLERQAMERTATSAKSVGMDIGFRLLTARELLLDRASRRNGGASRDDGPMVGPPPPGIDAVELAPLASLPTEQRDRLESGRSVLEVLPPDGVVRIGVPLAAEHAVLWGALTPARLWGLVEGAPALSPGESLCILGPQDLVPVCTAESITEIRDALGTAVDGTIRTGIGTIGSAWTLFLGFEFGAPSWRIVVSQPAASITAPLVNFNQAFYTILALTFFVVLGLSAWMIRRAMDPLRRLKRGTEELGARNLGYRVTLAHRGHDEFHDLAASFNEMAGEIGNHLDTLVAINDFDRAVLSSLDRTTVITALLARGARILPDAPLALVLADRADRLARWHVYRPVETTGQAVQVPARMVAQATREPEGWSAVTAELDDIEQLLGMAPRSIAAARVLPLRFGEDRRGILLLGSTEEAAFDQAVNAALRHLVDQAAVALQNVTLVEQLGALHRGALEALANAIDAKSHWTAGHSQRVTRLAVRLGKELALPETELERLYRGGLLHDIGKIGIAQEILDKPGQLTAAERATIESHPVVGATIVQPITAFEDVIGIVRHHHERWDGAGYPDRLAGRAIPRLARVLSLADVYDALSSPRPYRDGLPHDVVMGIIARDLGQAFDPEIGAVFLEMMRGDARTAPAEDGQVTTLEGVS